MRFIQHTVLSLALVAACGTDDGDDGNDDGNDDASDATVGDDANDANDDVTTMTPADDSSDGGNDDGSELSAECTALCDHTGTATATQAACTPLTLEEAGGYSFSEQACEDFAAAFANGVATSSMCVACYLAAEVESDHCVTAEMTCF